MTRPNPEAIPKVVAEAIRHQQKALQQMDTTILMIPGVPVEITAMLNPQCRRRKARPRIIPPQHHTTF